MRRDYLIAILLALAAIPSGAALMVAPEYLHLTGWAVPATFWGGIGLTVMLLALAGAVAWHGAEKAEPERTRVPKDLPPRDVLLVDALWRIYTGRWDAERHRPLLNDDTGRRWWKACREIRQAAFDGKLPVWAVRKHQALYEYLPPSYWENRQIIASFQMAPEQTELLISWTHALAVGEVPHARSSEWEWHMTSKAKVDELWPASP